MNRIKRTRLLSAAAILLAALALTGCLRFENTMDLNVPLTTGVNGTPVTEPDGTTAPWDTTTAPEGTTANGTPIDGTTADVPTADSVSAAADQTTTLPPAGTTAAPTESTTGGNPQEGTTAVLTPAQQAQALGSTEYDVLRSNNMTVDGTFGDTTQTSPIRMSIGEDKVYILSEMDGLTMGIYIEGKKTYIYLPSQKKYLKLNSAVAKLMGIDPNEFAEMASEMGFDSLPPLTQAYSAADGTMNGAACKLFLIKANDGTVIRVGMNGKKLVGIEYLDASGNVDSFMYLNSVTSGFPKMPPDGYEEMGYMEFAKLLMAEMDEG